MRRLTRATIALPLAVVLAGILIPLLLGQGDRSVAPGTEGVPLEIKGRTAVQWATAAQEAAERSEFNLALRCIKTAEQADPGTQYAESLTAIRRARWRYQEALELQDRLLHGPLESAAFGDDGSLLVGYRTVVALPGESLWSLARALVAAERGVLGDEVPQRDPDVYGHWDRLVELNGLRELEVGERVAFPLSDQDVVSIEASNRADLGRIADASVALDSGDVAEAEILLDGVTGSFARGTDAFRETRDAIDLARELSLVEGARETIEALAALPRASEHARRLEFLDEASAALSRAEDMRSGAQYEDARELVDRLSLEERRFEVRGDGSVVAVKPAGDSYTGVAREAVEWLLQRELASSGSAFPNSHLKTDDERAWARYMILARRVAEAEGADFAQLLSSDREVELHLPEPTHCFPD